MPELNTAPKQSARAQVTAGLRQLADYLDRNPGVPVNEFGDWQLTMCALNPDDADGKAEVDRIATILGVDVTDETADGGHYIASKSFGLVSYQMVRVLRARSAAYSALMSYQGAVQPDTSSKAA
jgi:hypothetical protein